jgi:hypothetical protein
MWVAAALYIKALYLSPLDACTVTSVSRISEAQAFVPVEPGLFALVDVKHNTPDEIGWFAGIKGVSLSGVVIAYFVKREPVIFQACSGDWAR